MSSTESDSTRDNSGKLPVLGSYQLIRRLGSGGMSTVFLAEHQKSHHRVALKILPKELGKKEVALHRFLKEAETLGSMDHPNIVGVFDRGFDHERHYLVFEYIDGGDLNVLVREHGPLTVAEATQVIRKVAEALKHATERGFIHRDIKPSNILVTSQGDIKLADLGLAIRDELEDDRITREGTTVGTVDYMSPEQARDSRNVSIRSDMYSLGGSFYYLLVGEPPYVAPSILAKIKAHALSPPPNPREKRQDVPKSIAWIIQKMMAKSPDDRFQTYEDLLHAIEIAEKKLREKAAKVTSDMAIIDEDPVIQAVPVPKAEETQAELGGVSLAELLEEDQKASHILDTKRREALEQNELRAMPLQRQRHRQSTWTNTSRSSWDLDFNLTPEKILWGTLLIAVLIIGMYFLINNVIAPVPQFDNAPRPAQVPDDEGF